MKLTSPGRRIAGVAVLGLAAAGLAACAAPADGQTPSADPIEFWGWAPGYADAVDLWNETHDQKVVFETTPSGSKGGYTKVQAAAKAGNGPCLAQVGNESIASFVLEGMLEDVADEAAAYEDQYPEAAWSVMKVADGVYGIPVDSAPLGLFYRADVYERLGLTPATTWEEFAAQSAQVRASDPSVYLSSFSPADMGWWGGLTQQARSTWFDIDGDAWKVTVDSPETQQIAEYWQGLLDTDAVLNTEIESPEWWEKAQSGAIASHIAPVWWAGVLEGAAANSSGQWRVAPLPNIDADDPSNGTQGGSATAVVSGCDNVEGALEFANWMSTDEDALQILIDQAAVFPASLSGATHPALDTEVEYFGGQQIFQVFVEANEVVDSTWAWGPMTTQTGESFDSAMQPAVDGTGTLSDGLVDAQANVVKAFTAKGLSVSE